MSVFGFIASIFEPATKIIDEIHVSDEERLKLRNELAKIQADAQSKLIELEQARLNAHSSIVTAEMNSKNYLASSWRPLASLSLVTIVILGSFEVVTVGKELYDLLEILLGTYAGSRGLEKIAATMKIGK